MFNYTDQTQACHRKGFAAWFKSDCKNASPMSMMYNQTIY